MKDGFHVRRLTGEMGERGTAEVVDRNNITWEVPIVKKYNGLIYAAQNEYECSLGIEPSWELRGDLNDAVDEYFNSGEVR